MPNPKAGTVTDDVARAIKAVKAGRVEFKMTKTERSASAWASVRSRPRRSWKRGDRPGGVASPSRILQGEPVHKAVTILEHEPERESFHRIQHTEEPTNESRNEYLIPGVVPTSRSD